LQDHQDYRSFFFVDDIVRDMKAVLKNPIPLAEEKDGDVDPEDGDNASVDSEEHKSVSIGSDSEDIVTQKDGVEGLALFSCPL
jgi:hypothetical protein